MLFRSVDAKVGENDQLFGSVTGTQIVAAIKEQLGVEVDRKRLVRSAAINTAGRHQIEINLYREINAVVTVLVGVTEEAPVEEPAEAEEEVQVEEAGE